MQTQTQIPIHPTNKNITAFFSKPNRFTYPILVPLSAFLAAFVHLTANTKSDCKTAKYQSQPYKQIPSYGIK